MVYLLQIMWLGWKYIEWEEYRNTDYNIGKKCCWKQKSLILCTTGQFVYIIRPLYMQILANVPAN